MQPRSLRELESELAGGTAAHPQDFAGYAFRGVSLGLPKLVDKLLWKTFAKVFVPDGNEVRGFNLRIVQGQPTYRPRARKPRFGEFVAVAEGDATVLEYGLANPRWHPLAPMRDRIVSRGPDLFLGRAYVALLGREISTPSYFTLERARKLDADITIENAHDGLGEI